ncbi:colipase-like protein 2 [Pteropus alecto]|uniref:Colipase-like protein 2 n=1 Tax=Pteropus vampyrus TaxID=132908 RepID=A0A6P3R5U8_PTEVA|nr:colipase-like protein 2 [Pteropus alecto]XP_011371857.1 colipase-like protein 2 [Pteropus vampyrus]
MATAFALIAGVLLPGWGEFSQFKKVNGAVCSHRSECFSDCCLIDLDQGGTFCAPKARIAMACLPQTKGAINIICPCQMGLRCKSKDVICPRRCYLF